MKKEKQTKCINCKYWNIYVGCVLSSQKEEELDSLKYKNMAYNKDISIEMPPKIPSEYNLGEASKFFRKGKTCKWYKFSLLNSIMNKLDALIN